VQNISQILQSDSLVKLVQKENFVGWAYYIDYEKAFVMTNDLWKHNSLGVPHNCFLVAATFNPDEYNQTPNEEKEVLLLRVIGSCKLPQDDDLVRTRVDHFQQKKSAFDTKDYDDITLNQLQFGGLECRVLGTFYIANGVLKLGSDLESFASASRLKLYRPRKDALDTIVNYVDPQRKQKSIEEAKELGLKKTIESFPIGTVRYTSTERIHRQANEAVPVRIQPSDFLARRTAVLGMTRTGKSNMIKQLVSVVKRVADQGDTKVGQLVFDMNGEYANANKQDKGAIADIFPKDTVRYRMMSAEGFEPLQNNFYLQLEEGFSLLCEMIIEKKRDGSNDIKTFLNISLEKPEATDFGEIKKWNVRVALYRALLYQSQFKAPPNLILKFEANEAVRKAVQQTSGTTIFKNPADGLTPAEAVDWFLALRQAAKPVKKTKKRKVGDDDDEHDDSTSVAADWLNNKDDLVAMLNLLAAKNNLDTPIAGYKIFFDAKEFHTPNRTKDVGREIYEHLVNGKIVILDLTVGKPSLRERLTKNIADQIFTSSMGHFIEGKSPENIVMYIEEAHNLIGKDADLDDTWPRIAKEGAKYKIALVYATQEVSAMHPNILANTENWFITHLNNHKEINELAKFYDFDDFSKSLIRAQDVGFTRVKTLSGSFVIPVQIDKFDPLVEKSKLKQ